MSENEPDMNDILKEKDNLVSRSSEG